MSHQTVFIIHTSSVSVAELGALFRELAPAVAVRNIIDDSLLPEVLSNGGVTDNVGRRMISYFQMAELAGADLIFNQCSSVGEAADRAAAFVKVPVVKVDRRMAEVACGRGKRIGIIATLETTLGPTSRLVAKTAEQIGKKVEIVGKLCEGAFERLIAGDRAAHNRMVIGGIDELARGVDVIVCAQGSMTALLGELGQTAVPVLTSPRLGVQDAVEVLSRQR